MQDQPIAGTGSVPAADEVAGWVLATLLERQPALVPLDDLVRELVVPGFDLPATFVEDSANELIQAGLAHRLDRFFFASHAAVRAEELRP